MFFKRKKDNKDVSLDPWASKDQDNLADPPNKNKPPASNPAPSDTRKVVLQAMRKQGLYDGLDLQEFMQAMQDGKPEAVEKFFATLMENAALTAIQMADQIAETKMQRMTQTATDTATQHTKKELLREEMFESLPFTKEGPIRKIAEQALDGFLEQGQDPREAIANVKEFFKDTAHFVGKHYGMQTKPQGGNGLPGNRQFSDSRRMNNNDDDTDDNEPDWMSVLTHGAQQFQEPGAGDSGDESNQNAA